MDEFKKIKKIENLIEWEKELGQIVISSLNRSLFIHDNLGKKGEEFVQKNQFGEMALKIDIECEKAILDLLKEIKVPIRVLCEEHGQVDITKHPRYLGILDGLDGSNVYKKERGRARYGTMFGIFNTINPSYRDYLINGVMEHSTKRLFIAFKNGGAFVIKGNKKIPIHSSNKTKLDQNTQIYIDEYFEINRYMFSNKLQNFKPKSRDFSAGSSAVHYVDAASGAVDLVLECTRKKNFEIAVAYGLETEAGAVMVDLNGADIGNKKYLEFGQQEKIPIITAATKELADRLLEYIKIKN